MNLTPNMNLISLACYVCIHKHYIYVYMRSKYTDDITHYINIHVSLVLLIPSGAVGGSICMQCTN